ncbi:hypothetical protein [Aquimarina megaterium]|uniref:hypothetical protein n=1 Tax=Aquimarina megaterium TaxID=1443666 RepID=UPI0009434B19|nr:hypothetical protein [Aquimarina megaterium]
MATLKGAIRTYGATVRKIEREQQKRAREAARKFKEQQKLQEIQDAKKSAKDWSSYVEMLQSVHKNCTNTIDWEEIKREPKPIKPIQASKYGDFAQKQLNHFHPSIIDKIFGFTKTKIKVLEVKLIKAKEKDENEFNIANENFKRELNNWEELQEIAEEVENQNPEFYKKALECFNPFSDIRELGTQIKFSFNENHIDIELYINSEEIIPDYELKLTSTGKLSKKSMVKSKFNELYQDHICSSVLRIAREVFAYLPISHARINAISNILNTKTGHLEEKPILSVIIPPETINVINLEKIDPSDCMDNFIHNMNFKKTTGFSAVEKVEKDK